MSESDNDLRPDGEAVKRGAQTSEGQTKHTRPAPMNFEHRREVVAAMINERITTDPQHMIAAMELGLPIKFIDRLHLEMMASLDLGPEWRSLADSPTIFWVKQDGSLDELTGLKLHVRRRG